MNNNNNTTQTTKPTQPKQIPTVAVPVSVAKRIVREAAKQNINRAGQRNILRRLLGK